jgi:hypothetical protein
MQGLSRRGRQIRAAEERDGEGAPSCKSEHSHTRSTTGNTDSCQGFKFRHTNRVEAATYLGLALYSGMGRTSSRFSATREASVGDSETTGKAETSADCGAILRPLLRNEYTKLATARVMYECQWGKAYSISADADSICGLMLPGTLALDASLGVCMLVTGFSAFSIGEHRSVLAS